MFALSLSEHGFMQIVGDGGSERGHGFWGKMRRNERGGKTGSAGGPFQHWVSYQLSESSGHSVLKRQRTAAVQNASAPCAAAREVREVLDCGSPLPL